MTQTNSEASVSAHGPVREMRLARLVEADIIPRLMLLHEAPPFSPTLGDEDVAALVATLRTPHPFAAQVHVAQLLASGVLVENLIAQLIAPALARLEQLRATEDWTTSDIFTALERLRQLTIKVESDYVK